MRNFSGVDSSTRSKFYSEDQQQHLDPIAEYEDELDIDYVAEDENYDNETVDEEEYQYFDNDQYVIENRKRYIKPAKSREAYLPPTRANYIYKKKQIESSTERSLRKPNKISMSSPLSPVTSKSKVEPPRWNKSISPVTTYQRVSSAKPKKTDGSMSAIQSLNLLREKMMANLPSLSKPPPQNPFPSEVQAAPAVMSHHSKSKRRNTIATEQIHHDSGDGPMKIDFSELLKITDESNFSESIADNEVAAELINNINSLQLDNARKIKDMDRQKQNDDDQYYPKSLNFDSMLQQFERKLEADQQQSSSNYQPFSSKSGMAGFPQNFMETLNYPMKKNSSTQTNLGVDDTYSSEQVSPECDKYDEACGQDDNDNQNWNGDDVSNLVSSSKEDLTELRNLQKTKRMICELINKEIEKIAKMKNLDMSVSRRFLLEGRESMTGTEDYRKTRLDTLTNLQNGIKKLITLETGDD